MAEEKEANKQKNAKPEKTDAKGDKKTAAPHFLKWIIMAVVVTCSAAGGFGLGRLFAGFRTSETTESRQQNEPPQKQNLTRDGGATDFENVWYYPLDPVVANLDVPGVTRYVRATLVLAIDAQIDQEKGATFLEGKKPVLNNWLTIYLASLSLEDSRGDRNLKRIQSQILDAFNETLFPDEKPPIKKILFKEFAIQ
jgi:flagellar basal body-associated protein FliL